MSDVKQIRDDLQFVRHVVDRRERSGRGPVAVYWYWAAYVLIGYTMIDVATRWAGWFFMVGGLGGGVVSGMIGRRYAERTGERDRLEIWQKTMHFGLGIILAFLATFALAWVIPELRGPKGSQVMVVMIGIIYFLSGVHFDRNFLWLGPVVMAGGVLVGLVPHYGWTMLGAVIAVGLVLPTLVPPRPPEERSGEERPAEPK
jgi:hypothetical protein